MKDLEPEGVLGTYLTVGVGAATLLNKAPHPNAARVYLNWLLTKDGQTEWVKGTNFSSRRLDVAPPPGATPYDPKKQYPLTDSEKYGPQRDQVMQLSVKYLG